MNLTSNMKTGFVFLWTRVLSTPFYVLFTLLSYILYKDVGATLFQVTTLIVLKPAISLIAPYFSVWIEKHPKDLIRNLTLASSLKFIPFLFTPWIDQVEYFILASVVYLILDRGVIPAWLELLKLNLPPESRTKVFAYSQAFDYLAIALIPLLFGTLLDTNPQAWRWLFFGTSIVGILSSLLLKLLNNPEVSRLIKPHKMDLLTPWKQTFDLLRLRPDFARFQIGFMLGGAGLMVIHPALPFYFTDTLNLSYKEMAFAIAFCKGIGYAIATPFWASLFGRLDIFKFCGFVTILAAIFPLILLTASFKLVFLWIAFLSYGVMQAGSELSWHLSGPVFSRQSNSTIYSQTNILAQGVRGAVIPFLGMTICNYVGAEMTLFVGGLFCILGTMSMFSHKPAPTALTLEKTG